MSFGAAEVIVGLAFTVVTWFYSRNNDHNKELDKRIDSIEQLLIKQDSRIDLLDQRNTYQFDMVNSELTDQGKLIRQIAKCLNNSTVCSNFVSKDD